MSDTEPNEKELWHALQELMRRIPHQDREQRAAVMAAAVRSALYARMAQAIDPVAHIQNPEPPISDEAELTLAAFRQDPPFSLPRIQTRTAQKKLDQELDQWPAERRAELIHEMRDRLERRRIALGEIQPADAARECVSQAEVEIAETERRGQADMSDRPRWGRVTAVYSGGADVWDGAICWPVDTTQGVSGEFDLGAIVWFSPRGEWAVVERVESPGESD